jgi:CRISPR system Cascade subunit CasA
LIDAPGESGIDGNKDLFVKRGVVREVCVECAATAVLTLQINAPEGGRGHYTGLRGGGPLTTLVYQVGGTTLWRDLWMNVIEGVGESGGTAEPESKTSQSRFPWVGTVEELQRPGGSITAAQVSPLHAFWATPRRVRLDIERAGLSRTCSICARPSLTLVSSFRSRPNGIDYPSNAWLHPLTPYREKDGAWLPVRPKGDGVGYRHWLAWTLTLGQSVQRRAKVVEHALTQRQRQLSSGLRLWAFGYEMRKDNPICWHDASLPLFDLAECDKDKQALVQSEVIRWLNGAELAAMYLRGGVKDAWFSATARGDFSHIDAAFWSATEAAFYMQLQALIDAARDGIEPPPLPARTTWHAVLTRTALRLFDDSFVGAGAVERQNPRRIALAHRQLRNSLHGPKLKQALGLPVEAPATKAPRKSAKRNPKETA